MVVLINNPILQGMSNLNLDEELKYYGLGAQMIKHHNINNIIILSNSNYKGIDLSIYGINELVLKKLIMINKKKIHVEIIIADYYKDITTIL